MKFWRKRPKSTEAVSLDAWIDISRAVVNSRRHKLPLDYLDREALAYQCGVAGYSAASKGEAIDRIEAILAAAEDRCRKHSERVVQEIVAAVSSGATPAFA